MQGTFGAEVIELVWFTDKNCDDKISSDSNQRGELFSNDKKGKKKDWPIYICGSCLVCVQRGMNS